MPADAAWYRQTVQSILKRKTYTGTWEYGKKGKDETIPVAVPPIVDKQVWDKAQTKLEANKRSRVYVKDYPYLVRELAYCGVCGAEMCCKSDASRKNRPRYYSYYCSASHPHYKGQRCNHTLSYRADIVDKEMWSDITLIVSDPATLQDAYTKYMKSLKTRVNPSEKQLDTKQKLIRTKKRKIEKLLDVYLDGDISKKQYQERKSTLEEEMNRYKAEASTLKDEIQAQDDVLAKEHSLKQYIDQLPDLMQFATGNKEAQMGILKRLGVAVMMYPEGEYKSLDWALFGDNMRLEGNPARLSCVYRAKTTEPRIWLSGTLVFKRKFIKVKHQNLDVALVGVA